MQARIDRDRMYVNTNINEHQVISQLDIEANLNYISQDIARRIELTWVSASEHFNGVNGE